MIDSFKRERIKLKINKSKKKGEFKMKKLILVMCFIFLLCSVFAFSIFANETAEEQLGSDLMGPTNIAPNAEVTARSNSWVQNGRGDEKYLPRLVDQDLGTGVGSSQYDHNISIYFTFDDLYVIDRLVLWFNQTTDNPTGVSGEANLTANVSGANQDFDFTIKLYDINEKKVFEQTYNTKDQKDIVIVPYDGNGNRVFDEVYKLEYWQGCEYNPQNTLWEVEIHKHICEYDTLASATKEPTCTQEGVGTYKCECGKTKKNLPIPPLGYHPLDSENPEIIYENGILQTGEERHHCTLCEEYYESHEIQSVFKFLGYSASFDKTSICVGYAINEAELAAYEKSHETTLKYGAVISSANADSYVDNGAKAVAPSTIVKEAQDIDTLRFDIKLSSGNWNAIADRELIMCAYVIENDSVSYLGNDNIQSSTPQAITYNQIV